jgi:RNA polymerase sigma-70 factor (ECF subfamily)
LSNKQQEFTALYLPLHPQLARYCKALVNDTDDAKDLLSDTVSIAYQQFEAIRDHSAFKYYLFGIAIRLFRKKLSRSKTFISIHSPVAETLVSSSASDAQSDVGHLYQAIDRLNPHQKEIVVLFELSGFSLNEIAELKNMNLSTVKTHLSRGRQELIRILNPRKETIH